MDGELVLGICGVITTALGLLFKDRKDKRDLKAKQDAEERKEDELRPDLALQRMAAAAERADEQANEYLKRLKELQNDLDHLQAKHKQLVSDMDGVIQENRTLRQELEAARVEIEQLRRERKAK